MLDRSNDVGKSIDVSWVVFDTVREKKRNLFCLNTLLGQKVSLCSFNGVSEALFEDELIIITDGNRNHKRSVGWQCLLLSQLNELSQEEVLWLVFVTDQVLDHDDCVV